MNRTRDSDDDPSPDWKRWLISCDESGVNGARFYAFGSLWMAWQRRGEFSGLIDHLRDQHGYIHEIKWNHVKARHLDFYTDLVEEFFRTPWLGFHCVIVEKAVVRKELHGGDYDLARRKHLTMLLKTKIRACMRAHPERRQTFRIWTDPIHSRYAKADEALEIIANRGLAQAFGGQQRPIDSVIVHDSANTPSIQLCDLLLGAVAAAWEGDASAEAKLDLQGWIAHHLGWADLHADTRPDERKFNIWVFYDPTRGPRRARTRDVRLAYELCIPAR